jgi:hypothetical protein
MAVPGKKKNAADTGKYGKDTTNKKRKNENLVVFSIDCFQVQPYTITIESKYTGS